MHAINVGGGGGEGMLCCMCIREVPIHYKGHPKVHGILEDKKTKKLCVRGNNEQIYAKLTMHLARTLDVVGRVLAMS